MIARDDDPIRWLALLIRQGLKLIVTGIERRYGLGDESVEKRYGLTDCKDVIESD